MEGDSRKIEYSPWFSLHVSRLRKLKMFWGHSGVVVSTLDFRSEVGSFMPSPYHCVVSLDKIICLTLSLCLHPGV